MGSSRLACGKLWGHGWEQRPQGWWAGSDDGAGAAELSLLQGQLRTDRVMGTLMGAPTPGTLDAAGPACPRTAGPGGQAATPGVPVPRGPVLLTLTLASRFSLC